VRVSPAIIALAVGLLAGFVLGCVVIHEYDLESFHCPAHLRPQCCDSCTGVQPLEATCSEAGWACPPPSVSSFDCAGQTGFCRSPVVVMDGGTCSDAGMAPSQAQYAFPGCSGAGGVVCPNDLTLSCALASVKFLYDECRFSADCVEAPIDAGCTGYGACFPYSVTAANKAIFTAAAQAEVTRYCDCPTCAWRSLCTVDAGAPSCRYGRCTWVPNQVSYSCANRQQGSCYAACADDEACFTQVACSSSPLGDGGYGYGCAAVPDAGAQGDELCHRRCLADGGCPAGQACFDVAFYGCGAWDGGAPPTESICCSADAGCG
jgi:hypothetical protein